MYTEHKQENLYEKIKKVWNNSRLNTRTKFLLSSVISASSVIGSAKFLDYLTSSESSKKILPTKERIINGVKLSIVDQIFISNSFFVCAWDRNSCWHDAFLQYLMLPEILSNNYNSEKIMKMINWIRDQNSKFSKDRFAYKVKVDMNARQMYDDDKKFEIGAQGMFFPFIHRTMNNKSLRLLGISGAYLDIYVTNKDNPEIQAKNIFNKKLFLRYKNYLSEDEWFNWYIADYEDKEEREKCEREYGKDYFKDVEKCKQLLKNPKLETFELRFCTRKGVIDSSKEYKYFFKNGDIDFLREYNYRPNFIVVFDSINYPKVPHFYAYYIIYDKNYEIKYFILADGLKKGLKPIKKSDVLKDLRKNEYVEIDVRYVSNDIIRKYYIPELMQNSQ